MVIKCYHLRQLCLHGYPGRDRRPCANNARRSCVHRSRGRARPWCCPKWGVLLRLLFGASWTPASATLHYELPETPYSTHQYTTNPQAFCRAPERLRIATNILFFFVSSKIYLLRGRQVTLATCMLRLPYLLRAHARSVEQNLRWPEALTPARVVLQPAMAFRSHWSGSMRFHELALQFST